jgi:hypothetical protein
MIRRSHVPAGGARRRDRGRFHWLSLLVMGPLPATVHQLPVAVHPFIGMRVEPRETVNSAALETASTKGGRA